MESLTKRHLPITAIWDDEHVKALLRFPRFPMRLIQQEPWQSWIGKRGGIKAIHAYLQGCQFPPTHRRILEVVLSNPESVSDVYADRLNISRATYFSQLRELITAIAQALNHWDIHTDSVPEIPPVLETNLPAPLTSLVGVDTTLQTLLRLITREDIRLLTLLGPGGIGKTRLSIELARRLECEVCFVDLSSLNDPLKIVSVIAQKIGIRNETVAGLRNVLKNRDFLLILDNFEQLLPAKTLVADLLTALVRLKIVVTSRAALHIYGEYEFIVPKLTIADIESVKGQQLWVQSPAVTLFVQRAQAVNPNFSLNNDNVEIVTELCYRMEGLPLAIELAAYQMKYFSPQAMLAQISKNRLDFLGQDPQRMPPRQQTLRAMLDWSFNLLSPELQNCFCQISIFPDSFTIADVDSICNIENAQVVLNALIDQSLLEQSPCTDGQSHFKMLGMVREYACEQLQKLNFQPTS